MCDTRTTPMTRSKAGQIISRFEKTISDATDNVKGELIVGTSGGADSTALLSALVRNGRKVVAVHCNFQLRGEESERDEIFTKKLCGKLGVECITTRFNVAERCRQTGESVEMACRELRYDFFRQTMRHRGCSRIAIAHTNDDNIETMLLNLFRGTGIDGLRGMLGDTGEIIRPMLSLSRKDVEDYLEVLEQDFITDSSNLTNDYRRNLIRRSIIPALRKEWPGITSSLSRTRRNMEDVSAIYHEAISRTLGNYDKCLPIPVIRNSAAPRALIFEFIRKFGGTDTIADEITKTIVNIFGKNNRHTTGKRWKLENACAVVGHDSLEIVATNAISEDMPEYECIQFENSENLMNEIRKTSTHDHVWLPRPIECYRFRKPVSTDSIRPIGLNGSQKIRKILKDAKLPQIEKQSLYILTDAETDEPIWIPGLKRSRVDLITADTAIVYRLNLKNRINSIKN